MDYETKLQQLFPRADKELLHEMYEERAGIRYYNNGNVSKDVAEALAFGDVVLMLTYNTDEV
jgi:hypothetical protein